MSNTFCRFLSNGYSFHLDNQKLIVKPCCWYQGGTEVKENFELNSTTNNIDNWTDGCTTCRLQEQAGQPSFRKSSFDIVPDLKTNFPVAVDINIDYHCNAACVMCNENLSSFWNKENIKQNKNHIKINYNQFYLQQIIKNFDFSHVKRIKFFGGEPLLTDTHLKILKNIPNPESCDIWYTTNGSILPKDDVIELWSKFKLVFFEVSIDGIGEKFNYLRWPLKWHKLEKNLYELKEKQINNLLFRINHTLNPFNVLYYSDLEQWVNKNFLTNKFGDPTEINIHPSWGIWDLSMTPVKLREAVYETYPEHVISKILGSLPVASPNSIMQFIEKWEPIRKNSWKKTFPEIISYFS